MAGESQAAFIARVREALRTPTSTSPGAAASGHGATTLPDDLEIARIVRPDDDLPGLFARRVGEAGMTAHRVADEAAMIAKVGELLAACEAKRVIVPAEEMPARDRLLDGLHQGGVQLMDPDDPDASFGADAGITGVDAAIAETASLLVSSGGPRRRLASLAVPVHIAIVRADQILPDLLDWGTRATGREPAASEVFISGPSKTADIEMTLVTGVHGPGQVHVLILD